MRNFIVACLIIASLPARGESPVAKLWAELQAKREALPAYHQEFEKSQNTRTVRDSRASDERIIVDAAGYRWREKHVSGAGDRIRIFDGDAVFLMEDGGTEYVRTKRRSGYDHPEPYRFEEFEWAKATEVERRPCGLPGRSDTCVILNLPLKRWVRQSRGRRMITLLEGATRVAMDLENGLLLQSKTYGVIDNQIRSYHSEFSFSLKTLDLPEAAPNDLFRVPDNMVEVKKLTPWNAARMKKELVGKSAPELVASDMQGNPVTLSALKGKTVLLDFWASWCPPCRADVPALERLYKRYGDKELAVIGVSVDEEREIVEKFLKEHPHSYPVVLTTENEMPRPYQIGIFPTYIVIDPDGKIAFAVEGDKGFGELRRLLLNAGLEME